MPNVSLCLITVDNKILLFKRSESKGDKYSNMYGLIGGHVKQGESNLEGLKRETMEEGQIHLINPTYIKSYKFGDDNIHLYHENLKSTDGIRLNHEHTEFKLFNPEDLNDPSVVPTNKYMYNDYLKKADVVPENIIDKFYERIKDKLNQGHKPNDDSIKAEVNRIVSLNGKLPDKIKGILNDN